MSAFLVSVKPNPIHFVERDLNFTGEQIHYDKANAIDTVKDFQFTKHYAQPWKPGDIIKFQIHGFMVTDINCRIYKCDGTEITVANILPVNTLNDYQVGSIFYNIYQFQIDTTTIPLDTEFFIELRYLGQGVPTLKRFISGPQIVKSETTNTILYKYTHAYNDYNCIYAAANNTAFKQDFEFRVDGVILCNGQKSDKEVYSDQIKSETVLSAIVYPEYEHKVGIEFGVPDYINEILSYIICHTDVEVDDKKYAFGSNEWEPNDIENYTLKEYSIKSTEKIKQLGRNLGGSIDTTTCYIPSGLAVNVPTNLVTFTIAGFNGFGFYYEIREVLAGNVDSAEIAASGIVYNTTISLVGLGLEVGKTYSIYVKTICAEGVYSAATSGTINY